MINIRFELSGISLNFLFIKIIFLKRKYGKSYSSSQAASAAQKAYKATAADIAKHNANPKNSYKLGITEASDKTNEQHKKRRSYGHPNPNSFNLSFPTNQKVQGPVPDNKSYVSSMPPVMNQGDCGIISLLFVPFSTGSNFFIFQVLAGLSGFNELSLKFHFNLMFSFMIFLAPQRFMIIPAQKVRA